MLMGSGDFIDSLYNTLNEELLQSGTGVLKHHILSTFVNILKRSSLRNEKLEYLENLEIKLLEPSDGDIGWDIFYIDYNIPNILTYVINNKTKMKIIRLSTFLWKIRRCYYKLNDIWLEQKNILQKFSRALPYSQIWNKSNMIRHH